MSELCRTRVGAAVDNRDDVEEKSVCPRTRASQTAAWCNLKLEMVIVADHDKTRCGIVSRLRHEPSKGLVEGAWPLCSA